MQLRAEEISNIIKKQIQTYERAALTMETGSVLSVGDGIIVELADGTKVAFSVEDKKIIAYDESPQVTLLAPPKPGTFELRLITCIGNYSTESRTYDKRLVVTAKKQ